MLRLVDLKKALESRGYAPGSRGQIHFEVEDSVVSENSGRWVLNLSEKTIQKGGEGAVKLDIGAFGSLYSGFLSATQLAASGRLTGPTEQIKKADRAFAGEPRLRDFF
jgi:predicted acetyltransferase